MHSPVIGLQIPQRLMQASKNDQRHVNLRIKLYQYVNLAENRNKPEMCLSEISFFWTFWGMPYHPWS